MQVKTRSLNFGLSAVILLCGSIIANAASFNIPDGDVAALKAAMSTANTNHEVDIRAVADLLGSFNNDYNLHLLDSFFNDPLQAEPPSISAQPQSQTVTAPATATFSVTATGTAPLSYQWNKNGAVISGATSSTYTTPATTTGANGASFTVTVTNNFGSITSSLAILTVNPAPTMNSSPVGPVLIGGQPQSQMVIAPGSATFSATAIGTAPITYQWNKNGAPISGATSASYTTPQTTSADNGASFTVTVTNNVNGFTSAPATLTVTSATVAPNFAVQPVNTYVQQGNTAYFYVIATGTAPLSYQWNKNGTPISGATDASYTTPPTSSADNNAQFTVTVTNGAGSLTGGQAGTLTVTSNVGGLGGFGPLFPVDPSDLIGLQYRFQVATNQSPSLKIIFGDSKSYTPGSPISYDIETDVMSPQLSFTNGVCNITGAPVGLITNAAASLHVSAPDYPYGAGQQPALGSGINSSDPINWPIQTDSIDYIPHLYKSDSISQFNINGLETLVTIQRGGTLTDVSSFQRCGLAMLSGTYRTWTVTTQVTGYPTVVHQMVLLDADARYLFPQAYTMQFYSEFLNQPGTYTVQYWNFAYMRESNPVWTQLSTLKSGWNYDGAGQDFGVHVVTVNRQNRMEFSNVPGNSYLPGNLPFSIATDPTPTPTPRPATLGNISTRLQVGTSDRVMIAGFIVQGSAPKRVLIRAAGPSLTPFGVPNALANPRLELHDTTSLIGRNDDWQTTQIGGVITSDQVAEIQNSGLAPSDLLEAAVIATLSPGSYTAIVQGVNGGTGVGIVEVYDLNATSGSLLANISTRGFVQTGDNAMIGGFIVVTQATRVIIRAIGPSLSQFGVPDALANPQLELHDANSLIGRNDDWQTTQLGGIITSDQVGEIQNSQLAPTNPLESAIIATLGPGSYTAIVRGVNNTTGNALVEVYALP
jgi:hypothetical protein